jgi:hypothetical protein
MSHPSASHSLGKPTLQLLGRYLNGLLIDGELKAKAIAVNRNT